jgi:hypothetical protein
MKRYSIEGEGTDPANPTPPAEGGEQQPANPAPTEGGDKAA